MRLWQKQCVEGLRLPATPARIDPRSVSKECVCRILGVQRHWYVVPFFSRAYLCVKNGPFATRSSACAASPSGCMAVVRDMLQCACQARLPSICSHHSSNDAITEETTYCAMHCERVAPSPPPLLEFATSNALSE